MATRRERAAVTGAALRPGRWRRLARPFDRSAGRARDRPRNHASRSDGAVRRPTADPRPASRCSAPRSASPAPAASGSASRTPSARSTSFSTTATYTSTAHGSPRAARPASRGPVENHSLHEVPPPKPPHARRPPPPGVKELLGLPVTASLQQVIDAQEAERQRRVSLTAREKATSRLSPRRRPASPRPRSRARWSCPAKHTCGGASSRTPAPR